MEIVNNTIKQIDELFPRENDFNIIKKDFKVLRKLRKKLYNIPFYSQYFDGIDKVNKNFCHKDYYLYEDSDNFEKLLFEYLSKKKLNIDQTIIKKKYYVYLNELLSLKNYYKKDRPFVFAKKNNIYYDYVKSNTATSYSLPSGHSFHGMYLGYLIYTHNKKYFDSNHQDFILLVSYCVDVGLRRLIAGVHYPNDFICSYIMFMNILKHNKDTKSKYIKLVNKYISSRLMKYYFTD